MSLVEFKGVDKEYIDRTGRCVQALQSIDLNIESGSFTSLLGPSGCGKSTLLSMIAGFIRPTAGSVLFDDREIVGPGPERGMMFQEYALFPWLTVRKNILFGPTCVGAVGSEERFDQLVDILGLEGFEGSFPNELSGGMQQRVALARTLINRPRILLMDEPFAAVDALTREMLQDELLRLWRLDGGTIVFVTHSIMEAAFLSTDVVVLEPRPGRICETRDIGFDYPRERSGAVCQGNYVALERTVRGIQARAARK